MRGINFNVYVQVVKADTKPFRLGRRHQNGYAQIAQSGCDGRFSVHNRVFSKQNDLARSAGSDASIVDAGELVGCLGMRCHRAFATLAAIPRKTRDNEAIFRIHGSGKVELRGALLLTRCSIVRQE